MTSPSEDRVEMPVLQTSSSCLLECVQMRNWQKAIDVIASNRKAVYEQRRNNTNSNNISARRIGIHSSLNNNNNNDGHLAIHELCKITTSPTSVRFSKDEVSDDEGDDDDDDDDDEDSNVDDDDDDEDSNDTAEGLDEIFDACELEEGTKMYEVTQFMIDASHSIGPVTVSTPADEDENDVNNDPLEEGQREIEPNEVEHADNILQSENDETKRGFAVHKSILTYADSVGKTPLHVLCENSCDSSMMRVILGSTREATGNPQAPSALSLILAKDSRGCTPLHYLAYSRQCPFSSLKLMMEYCKPRSESDRWIDPTLCTDCDGETPLHWALAGYVSSRRIKELTRHSVDAIMVENNKGEKPFDQFTTNFVDSDWTEHDVCGNEVWENIQEYLRCIKDNQSIQEMNDPQRMNDSDDSDNENTGNDSEWLPLHFLAGSKYEFPPIFTDLALKYCGKDLQKFDAKGMLPLHLACARKSAVPPNPAVSKRKAVTTTDALAMKVLKKFQRASVIPATSTKRLALHFAVETQKPLSLIAALIRTYPRSLNIPDPVTKLWPYVLAGVRQQNENPRSGNESLSVSFSLLRADPSVLHLVRKNETISNLNDKEKAQFRAASSKKDEESTDFYMEHSSRRIRRLTIRGD
eukprot:CAMPEP_0116157062 /NCGR_PEP_ID=MMETSP0329-20121206/23150_1 /TAXON_ID=697910 /ORGANISM="Pseudo-nitzschia arenysensis, Strain B593" /LENGTH=637 /DNA_ID=CAMNT_0003654157 /DNA_START=114 /DNA_END=2027 /DNA_ORIENTATION=-